MSTTQTSQQILHWGVWKIRNVHIPRLRGMHQKESAVFIGVTTDEQGRQQVSLGYAWRMGKDEEVGYYTHTTSFVRLSEAQYLQILTSHIRPECVRALSVVRGHPGFATILHLQCIPVRRSEVMALTQEFLRVGVPPLTHMRD